MVSQVVGEYSAVRAAAILSFATTLAAAAVSLALLGYFASISWVTSRQRDTADGARHRLHITLDRRASHWYLIGVGARHVYTLEYARIVTSHPWLTVLTPEVFSAVPPFVLGAPGGGPGPCLVHS